MNRKDSEGEMRIRTKEKENILQVGSRHGTVSTAVSLSATSLPHLQYRPFFHHQNTHTHFFQWDFFLTTRQHYPSDAQPAFSLLILLSGVSHIQNHPLSHVVSLEL